MSRDGDARGDDDRSVSLGEVVVEHITERAVLVSSGGVKHWVPKSVIDDDSEIHGDSGNGECGELIVAEWWATKERIG